MRRFFVKVLLLVMFISGVLQMKLVALSWDSFRVIERLHIVSSVLIMFLFMNSFIYKHIRRYFYIKKINKVLFLN